MRMMVRPIVVGALGTVPIKDWGKDWKNWKSVKETRQSGPGN